MTFNCLAWDFETVIDASLARRMYGFGGTDAEVRQALRARQLEKTDGRSDMPKPLLCQVVALGMAVYDETGAAGRAGYAEDNEAKLLRLFLRMVAKKTPQLVGFNSSAYDLAVLRYRCLLHGLDAVAYYRPDLKAFDQYQYRYGEKHVDVCDVLSGFGASAQPSLHEAAVLCGFQGKGDVTGADVETLAEAGEWDRLRGYVEDDAALTLGIFLRWQVTRGLLAADQCERAVQALALMPTPAEAVA